MNLVRLFRNRLIRLRSALFFALFGTAALAAGIGLFWKALRGDNAAFLQQSIGDTSSLLALQAQLEIERLAREIREVTKDKVRPLLSRIQEEESEVKITSRSGHNPIGAALAKAASEIAAANTSGTIEAEPDISEVSFWRKGEGGLSHSRAYLAVNPGFGEKVAQRLEWLKQLEAKNRARIEPAFHGHLVVVSDPMPGLAKPIALLAVPLGHGEVSEVATAHVSMDKIQRLFAADGLVSSVLVDHDGVVLTHRDPQRLGRKEEEADRSLAPIFERLADSAGMPSGVLAMNDAEGTAFYGGYRKIGAMGMAVISVVSAEQGEASLDRVRRQLFGYVAFSFFAMLIAGWVHLRRVWPSGAPGAHGPAPEAAEASPAPAALSAFPPPQTAASPPAATASSAPRKVAVMAMHGSLRGFTQLLETSGPEDTTDALNDYYLAVASIVRASGGHFECLAGAAFSATWELKQGASALSKAVICGLSIRKEMIRLNESRKLDGKKPLIQGMGLHVGQALAARIGALPEIRWTVTGEALACARALDRLAQKDSKDFLVSQAVVETAHGVFKGMSLGEAKLTLDTGLTAFYSIASYRDDSSVEGGRMEPATYSGQEPVGTQSGHRPEAAMVRIADVDAPPARWLVNNGSQIVGPFTAFELSKMLFMQELDFDCECWEEATGKAAILEKARIFSDSQAEDSSASCWVFDGTVVHGPMTEGFVRVALQRNAFGENATVCEKTTIAGWRKASAFLTDRKPGTDSGAEAA